MFLKSLSIHSGANTLVRELRFKPGINLIVDETPIISGKETGNNVGKTTVLKLIDFCLGSSGKGIYADSENKKNENTIVREFLVSKQVLITLVLKQDLADEKSMEVVIERNFLPRKNKIQRVNGKNLGDDEYEEALTEILFPGHYGRKPTFRQIIAHNIRYKDLGVNNTLKILDSFTRDDEYETLYLFLFGCDFDQGNTKQELRSQIDLEEKFKRRLESTETKSAYETALTLLNREIEELEQLKVAFHVNPNFEQSLAALNAVKAQINQCSSEISRLTVRKDLIVEARQEMEAGVSKIDEQQLHLIYNQATKWVSEIQRSFDDLKAFHNKMVESKVRFIIQELPQLEHKLAGQQVSLQTLLKQESNLSAAITKSDSFEKLEALIGELNAKYQQKGEFENIVKQLTAVDEKLTGLNQRLAVIDDNLFSEEFALRIKEQVNKFNRHFSAVSHELYAEKYALKVDTKNVRGRRLYEFTAFNTNFSSGKKQGEISCFDIAYTLFADEENIPCLHFLLNDKKELMHDNQLVKIGKLVSAKGIQFVASILKDKLPADLNKDEYIVLKLSETDKLFRIEV